MRRATLAVCVALACSAAAAAPSGVEDSAKGCVAVPLQAHADLPVTAALPDPFSRHDGRATRP
ncbi:MAG: hypothetical protein EOP35_23555, partial [Rubrivivax sp.]